MKKAGKIHFVHHLEKRYVAANLGDWICCPYYYFPDYFAQYTCILHSDWAVLWHEIERDDIVIFGGGGLLDNSDELNRVLNRLINCCDNVIIWGAGTHKYNKDNIFGKKTATEEIHYDRAAIVGVRDYMHPSGLPYLPCVSCLNPAFLTPQDSVPIKRTIGTIKSALETNFAVEGLPSFVTNAQPIGKVAKYILSSQVILVSSYHGAYWAMLLGKKAVLPSTRLGVDKYRYFRHPVGFYDGNSFNEDELLSIASNLPEIPSFLEESRKLNHDFFEKTRIYIEARIEPSMPNETIQNMAKRIAQLDFTIVDMWNEIRRLNGKVAQLSQEKR
ncbi:hypothetical protein [Fuscovulum ytuae]|uniref:Polysaccharide pyruvyl transferase domain-containing protein n=1 Tax=Fuscovulum ytuae TaxID=3042299 RepID=A0ABY8QAS4_9RHOB|nr:hypothetical protein [Fuscovulum sp. YMD61]WGV17380.1 hypothetical protein QF092_06190 [Fuscovulum sp. YMD61]